MGRIGESHEAEPKFSQGLVLVIMGKPRPKALYLQDLFETRCRQVINKLHREGLDCKRFRTTRPGLGGLCTYIYIERERERYIRESLSQAIVFSPP